MEGSDEIYGDDFFVLDKENLCAICGKDKDLARFQTVPHLYRLNFPANIKS